MNEEKKNSLTYQRKNDAILSDFLDKIFRREYKGDKMYEFWKYKHLQ